MSFAGATAPWMPPREFNQRSVTKTASILLNAVRPDLA